MSISALSSSNRISKTIIYQLLASLQANTAQIQSSSTASAAIQSVPVNGVGQNIDIRA